VPALARGASAKCRVTTKRHCVPSVASAAKPNACEA
jgi:hypothetical protein